MMRFFRRFFGIQAPFCKRWGCDMSIRGFGPGREFVTASWFCADLDCGATQL